MANRNRSAGIRLEQDIVKRLKERGWKVFTSRYASRLLDDQGVDIVGDYPLKVQCKATTLTPNIQDLLETTEAEVILWRKMQKKGTQFYKTGEYAILELDEFLNLIDKAYGKERRAETQ